MSDTPSQSPEIITDSAISTGKRKHTEDEELEIDLNLPEPASKKAKRLEKRGKKPGAKVSTKDLSDLDGTEAGLATAFSGQDEQLPEKGKETRSDFSIWIGNLAFSTDKESLRRFFSEQGQIAETEIVRLHLPTTNPKAEAGKGGAVRGIGKGRDAAQNKGFAYIDFTTEALLQKALSLSERLLDGRKVLIKNAKSFEGRPAKSAEGDSNGAAVTKNEKQPSKRVFVGNLGFDVGKEELAEFYSRAGTVEDVFLATFEDSGKCKGFGWVTFADIEAAGKAVQGFVQENVENGDDVHEGADETGANKAKRHKKKIFINRLYGRQLRCEFAEDPQTRYKKRYSKAGSKEFRKDGTAAEGGGGEQEAETGDARLHTLIKEAAAVGVRRAADNADEAREKRRKRHEKMQSRGGQNQVTGQKASGAIVAGAGQRVNFDG